MGHEKEPLLMRIRGVSRRGLTLVILGAPIFAAAMGLRDKARRAGR